MLCKESIIGNLYQLSATPRPDPGSSSPTKLINYTIPCKFECCFPRKLLTKSWIQYQAAHHKKSSKNLRSNSGLFMSPMTSVPFFDSKPSNIAPVLVKMTIRTFLDEFMSLLASRIFLRTWTSQILRKDIISELILANKVLATLNMNEERVGR